MGCNCKVSNGGSQDKSTVQSDFEQESGVQNFVRYSAKIIGFLMGVILIPIIVVGIIWFMFDIIVLNKEVDLRIILKKIVKINKAIMTDDEDEEDEDYDEEIDYEVEEYITENVEEIK